MPIAFNWINRTNKSAMRFMAGIKMYKIHDLDAM